MLSTYHATKDYKSIVPECIEQLITLLKNPEVHAFLKLFIDSSIATSDLQILQRLAAVETALGLNDFSEEDSKPTIPAQLNALAERVDNIGIDFKPSLELIQAPATRTESRAHLLVQKLKSLKTRKHLDSKEIVQFLKYGIEERFRAKEGQNIRQIKKEVLEKAESMFKGDVELNKRKQGRREVRLILT